MRHYRFATIWPPASSAERCICSCWQLDAHLTRLDPLAQKTYFSKWRGVGSSSNFLGKCNTVRMLCSEPRLHVQNISCCLKDLLQLRYEGAAVLQGLWTHIGLDPPAHQNKVD